MSLAKCILIIVLWLCVQLQGIAQEVPTVVILADDAYPPYSFVEDGELKGIYIDILRFAAEQLSPYYKIELRPTPWQRGLADLEDGRGFALIPPYKHVESRPYIWPYSVALLSETVVAMCHKDVDINGYIGRQLNSLALPINVGINSGYRILSEELINAVNKGTIKLQENKDTQSNVLKLLHRRIDCYVNDRYSTLWELKQVKLMHPNAKFEQIVLEESLIVMKQTAHIGYTDSEAHSYVYKQDFVDRMDGAIEKFQASDSFSQLLQTYALP
ncbi:substrate-binding periplasmic protein [Thalassotalea fusca]